MRELSEIIKGVILFGMGVVIGWRLVGFCCEIDWVS